MSTFTWTDAAAITAEQKDQVYKEIEAQKKNITFQLCLMWQSKWVEVYHNCHQKQLMNSLVESVCARAKLVPRQLQASFHIRNSDDRVISKINEKKNTKFPIDSHFCKLWNGAAWEAFSVERYQELFFCKLFLSSFIYFHNLADVRAINACIQWSDLPATSNDDIEILPCDPVTKKQKTNQLNEKITTSDLIVSTKQSDSENSRNQTKKAIKESDKRRTEDSLFCTESSFEITTPEAKKQATYTTEDRIEESTDNGKFVDGIKTIQKRLISLLDQQESEVRCQQEQEEEIINEANYKLTYPPDSELSNSIKANENKLLRFAAKRLEFFIGRSKEKSSQNNVSGYSYVSYLLTVSNRKDIKPITIQPQHPEKLTLQAIGNLFKDASESCFRKLLYVWGVPEIGAEEKNEHFHFVLTYNTKQQSNLQRTILSRMAVLMSTIAAPNSNFKNKEEWQKHSILDVKQTSSDLIYTNYVLRKMIRAYRNRFMLDSLQNLDKESQEIENLAQIFEYAPLQKSDISGSNKLEQHNVPDPQEQSNSVCISQAKSEKKEDTFKSSIYAGKSVSQLIKDEKFLALVTSDQIRLQDCPLTLRLQWETRIDNLQKRVKGQQFDLLQDKVTALMLDPQAYTTFIADNKLDQYQIAFRTLLENNINLVMWLQTIMVPPDQQADIIEDMPSSNIKTILCIHGQSGIGKTFFLHDIMIGGMNSLAVTNSPTEFAPVHGDVVKTLDFYQFLYYDEADCSLFQAQQLTQLKALWEGQRGINVKHSFVAKVNRYRMPFVYLFNDSKQKIVEEILGTNSKKDEAIRASHAKSVLNRIEFVQFDNDFNEKIIPPKRKGLPVALLHTLFWNVCAYEFDLFRFCLDKPVFLPSQRVCPEDSPHYYLPCKLSIAKAPSQSSLVRQTTLPYRKKIEQAQEEEDSDFIVDKPLCVAQQQKSRLNVSVSSNFIRSDDDDFLEGYKFH